MTAPTDRMPLPHRGRAWALGVILPVLITGTGWVLVASMLPRLPEQVALHWGVDGVDRVGPVSELVTVNAVLGGISLVVLAVLAVVTGRTSLTRRLVLGLATGSAVFFTGLLLTQVLAQVDLTDPYAAREPDLAMTLTTVAAVVAGGLAAALAGGDPDLPATTALPGDAPRTALGAGERAVWTRRVTATRSMRRWGGLALALYIGFSLWLALVTDSWFVALLMLAIVPLVLTMLVWDVRVDATGLAARGAMGWPRQHVPASEVERAEVIEVSPFAEFGGWGLRTNVTGATGVVIRRGEAISVARSGGRRFVVTVDDAAAGAALLNTFAERARTAAH
ncbi:SdpI family protein [Georgenia subflava]|uniref:DUF1648 domain-containing protein n=1 Tax=Georgenia subflava TaxID=1622177 RepID=A0A6N7EP59_9MICO|nr:DUF1648 domain-containing protein [Georgenia subflava]MPV38315.1 hypothetical protein [Georgenia subflava]